MIVISYQVAQPALERREPHENRDAPQAVSGSSAWQSNPHLISVFSVKNGTAPVTGNNAR